MRTAKGSILSKYLKMLTIRDRSKNQYRRHLLNLSVIGLVLLATNLTSTPAAQASDEVATSYGLAEVPTGVVSGKKYVGKIVFIDYVKADDQGGEVRLRVHHSASCEEKYRFRWYFNRDIRQLRPGDTFVITVINDLVGGPCTTRYDASIIAGGNYGTGSSLMTDKGIKNSQDISGTTRRVYAKESPGLVVGTKSAEIRVHEYADNVPHWFKITIFAESHDGSIQYDVVYLYEPGGQRNRPPLAPTLLSPPNAYSTMLNPSSITFQWQNNGDPDNDPVGFYINIYQYNFNSKQWMLVYEGSVNTTSFTMTNLQPGSCFAWCVFSCDFAQRSDPWFTASNWFVFSTFR